VFSTGDPAFVAGLVSANEFSSSSNAIPDFLLPLVELLSSIYSTTDGLKRFV
jgi:hypothetical protein